MNLGNTSNPGPKRHTAVLAAAWPSARDILRDAIRNYQTNGDTNQAAAIALYAILSIIPLFILTLLTVDNLFSADPEIRRKLIEGIREFVPSFSGDLIAQIGRIEGKNEVLGWVGIVTLIWFSAMIFGAIETALDFIMRVKTHRNYFASKLLALAMIPLGWAVGVVSVGITSVAAILARQPFLTENAPFFIQVFRGTFFPYLLPYLVTVLYFTVVYKVIPAGNVGLMSALIGSAIFSALMEIAKQFFTWYVANYTALQRHLRIAGGGRHPRHLGLLHRADIPVLRGADLLLSAAGHDPHRKDPAEIPEGQAPGRRATSAEIRPHSSGGMSTSSGRGISAGTSSTS